MPMLDKPTSFTPQAFALTSDPLLPLELKGLSLAAGGRRLIDNVDLSVDGPGISVIMGPNGAGKSLLLRLMHGLIAPTKGDVFWAGTPMNAQIMRRQAMVFQKPVLLRRTAAANITHALGLRGVVRSERRSGGGERPVACPGARRIGCDQPVDGPEQPAVGPPRAGRAHARAMPRDGAGGPGRGRCPVRSSGRA